jgi:hypothetical protein
MFKFNRRTNVFEGLTAYLDEPEWYHSVHVLPLLAAMEKTDSKGVWPPKQRDKGLFRHLVWTLDEWSAFRSRGKFEDKQKALRKRLPSFCEEMRQHFLSSGAKCLASLSETQATDLGKKLDKYFWKFGPKIKAEAGPSYVLPSKLGHLLFPEMVPAFDGAVIENKVLKKLLTGMKDWDHYSTYFNLSWWTLQEYKKKSQLDKAREEVLEHLLREDWSIRALCPRLPTMKARSLTRLDSFVSEYTLIGLERQHASIAPVT